MKDVLKAANIIYDEICSQLYSVDDYPQPDNFLDNVDKVVPPFLKAFMSRLITERKKGSFDSWERKCSAISHAIISQIRPRSFISPLQLSDGTFLFKKYGSKSLIQVLSSLGFSASYNDIVKF